MNPLKSLHLRKQLIRHEFCSRICSDLNPSAHLLVSVARFRLEHLQQAARRQPPRCVDINHPLLQLVGNVNCDAETHLEDTGRRSGSRYSPDDGSSSHNQSERMRNPERISIFHERGGNSKRGEFMRRDCSPEIYRFQGLQTALLPLQCTGLNPAVCLSCNKQGAIHYSPPPSLTFSVKWRCRKMQICIRS